MSPTLLLLNFTLIILIFINSADLVSSLKCYSCSTRAGDRYCTEDYFDSEHLTVVTCPDSADVCIRAIQINNGNQDQHTSNAGSVFRACGTSETARDRELLSIGYYPIKNSCIVKKVGNDVVSFNNSVFQICACEGDLSNGRGEMQCANDKKQQEKARTKIIQPFEIILN